MIIPQSEKHLHPQYREYTELYEKTLTNLEAGARGSGAPEAIIAACLETARLFYDADCAALVEANLELGYGVCVAENCREGMRSFEGRIIDVTPENTPFLYDKIMQHEVFEVNASEISVDLPPEISQNEVKIFKRLNVEILVVAPYCKRNTGYLYILNPRRYVGLYGMIQALSYVCASERNEFKLMDDLNISVSTKKCKTDRDVYVKVFGGLSITTKFGTLTESEINSPLAIRLVAYLMNGNSFRRRKQRMANELAYYIRLSEADEETRKIKDESESISNQRALIVKYISDHPEFEGWTIREYVDDGFSGANGNRPAFQRMLEHVHEGSIQCIIVKDLSRFARNYILLGEYRRFCSGVRR